MTVPAVVTESKSRSRRALLLGAIGGLGAWAASAVGRASPVRAEGETMVVGGDYTTATSQTSIRNQTTGSDVFRAESDGGGVALRGISHSSAGVAGHSTSLYGVVAQSQTYSALYAVTGSTDRATILGQSGSSTGVLGMSAPSFPSARPRTGVFGYAAHGSAGRGVIGRSPNGQGVRGETSGGVAVFASADGGFALRSSGRVSLGKISGVATIAAGNSSKVVSPGVNITAGSFVLLTPKTDIGSRALWFTTNAADNKFTIRMSSSRSSGTKVAWLLLG